MKKFLHTLTFLCLAVLSQSVVSCGILDFELDENVQTAYDMQIERDTIYVMHGESFRLSVNFTPDSVSNKEIYWQVQHDSVVFVHGNDMLALSEGETWLYAISVQDRIADSCLVNVIPQWDVTAYEYPYEMVVNAEVKVGGQDPTADMKIGAFCGSELRGVGEWKVYQGRKFMQFRIYGHYMDQNSGLRERIRFRLYDSTRHQLRTFSTYIDYDGETHGTLSDLLELHLP